MSAKDRRDEEAIARLRALLPPGTRIYTILRHVSRSGMTRAIDVVLPRGGDMLTLGPLVARALGWQWDDRHDGVRVSGSGMDMGFHLIYSLAAILYPDGFKPAPDQYRFSGQDWVADGGYALEQTWL